MKMVDLQKEKIDLEGVLNLAREEPILLLTSDGQEFCIAEADDFEKEVKLLRESPAFQRFLGERSASKGRLPLEEIEQELERDLARERGIA